MLFARARQHWQRGGFQKAVHELEALLATEDLTDANRRAIANAQRSVDSVMDGVTGDVEVLARGPDYLASKRSLAAIALSYKGLPPGDAARTKLEHFRRDKRIKNEIRASTELEKLNKRYRKAKRATYRKALERFLARYKNTVAATRAQVVLASLK